MSKEAISSRLPSKTSQNEANENQFGASLNPLHFPPPRSPLNSIPDPSQFQKDIQESDQVYSIDRSLSDRKVVETSGSFVATHVGTPRVSVRSHGKIHSEPSSAQSTPARSGCSRVSLGGRGVSSSALFSRISRGISVVNHEVSVDVEHFELVDDPLFWKDHNVQVLIRIRPLSNIERVSQGYVRCLKQDTAQTLVWLGHPETRFTFDHIACEMISQEKLFRVAGLPMVENCLSGYNSCMFAYGQTGSGKTYTMMGEINEVEGKLNDDCGITPRIFEYLFSRIRMEEENRRDERLKFSCKCSFLEIYNEQITDLLEPSSTNLQLREDLKKGVYVENLTEYNVKTVNDVVKLLLQGAANRKMAATYMNSESSRSHSVLTCIIESHWEKDSMTHFRFARLNLVDLAGSERQKSSGAEGDRLKEAANINKSLSTLGSFSFGQLIYFVYYIMLSLVIMSLVDSAQGKHRHVPYRDSRLTFLLQAKVNENASGDVTALQRQIQQLKDKLSSLMKHQNLLRSPSSSTPEVGESSQGDIIKKYSFPGEGMMDNGVQNVQNEKTKRLECMLLGSLRREKMAEAVTLKLEAEIEHMNRLLCQREEDTQHTKMMLRFREEKIKQLELLVNGSVTAEKYLMDENIALKEEIQLLQARIDRNPELTRFALENIRLLEQLQLFQSFYEQGEREKLLAELAELRDQLLDIVEGKERFSSRHENQDNDTTTELENCRNMNSKLMREVEELRTELRNCGQATSSSAADSFSKDSVEFRRADKFSLVRKQTNRTSARCLILAYTTQLVETISMKTDSGDEQTPYNLTDDQNMRNDQILHPSDTEKQLTDAKMLIEALEREQVHQNRELHLMQEQNQRYMEVLSHRDYAEGHSLGKSGSYCLESNNFEKQKKGMIKESSKGIDGTSLQAKLDKLTEELETARVLNCQYQEDQASQLSCQHQVDLVREQVEMEATKTILQLQEEVASLQLELHENLCCMTEENTCLRNTIAAKEEEIRSRCTEWEKATLELTNFLADGSRSLRDASGQIESIVCLFPQFNVEVTENVGRAAKVCIEKDETILLLQKSLEEAQKMVVEMKEKCISLKGATIALNEIQHLGNEECTDEAIHLSMTLNKKIEMVKLLESELKSKEDQITEAEKRAQASFLVVKWLSDFNKIGLPVDKNSKLASQSLKEHESLKLENQFHILQQIKDELAKTNDRLHIIEDVINKISSAHVLPPKDEDMIDVDGWSADCSTSASDYSTDSVASEKSSGRSSYSYSSKFNSKATEEIVNLKFQGVSVPKLDLEESDKVKKLLKRSNHSDAIAFGLREEMEMAFNEFNKIYFRLTSLLNENDAVDCPLIEGMREGLPSFGLTMEIDEAGCTNTTEAVASETSNHASSFFSKFEEARETMREADSMLNTLLKANENAKQLNDKWRQAGEQLMADRASLTDEVEQLKFLIRLKEEENELLMDHLHFNMSEIDTSISLLEGCFLQVQKEVEDRFKELYSDALLMGRDVHHFISNSKSLQDDIFSGIMEKGFQQFVFYLCHIGAFMHKILNSSIESGFHPLRQQENYIFRNLSPRFLLNSQDDILITEKGAEDGDHNEWGTNMEEFFLSHSHLSYENLSLKKELQRKEVLLQGLLFDFSLLQESASNKKDIKDETEKLFSTLSQVRQDLDRKASQLDNLLLQHEKLEASLTDTENALVIAKGTIDTLSDQNADLRVLLKDLYLKKSEAEEHLEEQKEVITGLEKEILHRTSEDKRLLTSVESIAEDLRIVTSDRDKLCEEVESVEEELRKVSKERDKLWEEICSLNDKLAMAYALADENEAIAVEARQELEASKLYAEQKEEEVKILEHSIEELEHTVNALEKKVYEMNGEVERHHLIRDSLELEIQALRRRLSTVQNFSDIVDSENINAGHTEDQMSRKLQDRLLQLQEAHHRIQLLEREKEEQNEEIKRCKDYLSEVVLHSEAQASQYQQKYKTLEAMIREMQTNLSNTTAAAAHAQDKIEKSSTRLRGSSSPFRCIASVVQRMNSEKDQELSAATLRIQKLEALAASRQKEVCMLNTRLAAAESMTHDVIRDLLGVKLDMTNYAVDQEHVQKLVVAAQQQTQELLAKEQIILNLRKRIEDLIEEHESCTSILKQREADILAAQINVEQLRERDQLLSAQNDMLKESSFMKLGDRDTDFTRRLSYSEKLLPRVNSKLAQYRQAGTSRPQDKTYLPALKQNTGSRRLSSI
ncbi:kinesin-like protein KIN-12C [Citrus sinensis]|nr:kinesin-like protein KIN-12C [Citrus sinensis]